MSGQNQDQEKTEAATPRRKQDAAEEGQVPYSTEMTNAVVFLLTLGVFWVFSSHFMGGILDVMQRFLTLRDWKLVEGHGALLILQEGLRLILVIVGPIFLITAVLILLVGFGQVGLRLASKKLEPKLTKLDPIKGLKKLFSIASVMRVIMQILKVAAVLAVALSVLMPALPTSAALADAPVEAIIAMVPSKIFEIGFKVGLLLLLLAIFDVAFQRWKTAKDMRMSKQEVKDETKRNEGNPEIKSRVRQIQRERARARMLQDVGKATVVVRNPTHFAVALRYVPEEDAAPLVIAKGKDLIALKIIERAEEAGVPVKSDPPLARRLYPIVRVGSTIPEELFRAVAQLLAWVYRDREHEAG